MVPRGRDYGLQPPGTQKLLELWSLGAGGCGLQPPVDTPLANLAMGNISFFHFPGTKLLKITTKWLPDQIEPQKCIFEKSCAIEIDREKKAMKINSWVPGKMLHCDP